MYDLIIIGGGPAGLSACVYAGRGLLNTLIIEKKSFGGRIKDTEMVKNYPGIRQTSGIELSDMFRVHALGIENVERIKTTVTGVEKDGDVFKVHTKRRGTFEAKAVILALGTREKILGIEGEIEFSGRGVSYCATCDAEFVKDKDVHILGSGNVALEEAEYISKFANKVTIISIHPDGVVDADKDIFKQVLRNPKIDIIYNSYLTKIQGEEYVNSITLSTLGKEKDLETDGIFMFVGMEPQTEIVADLGILNENHFIEVDDRKMTKIPGLFAVGDCTDTVLRQAVVAASDGAIAAVYVDKYLRGEYR
ncbi:thioredoxin reductase (NADPH) [Peptoniphilus asaccharolyticus DSM 20463]|uniref:Thioredoxin reductase (NADPH) n=1 Tax=Peptoniphilus asaccharolyticus DSM 20463 TaxID=573058 RepID=A0A1W1V0J4_PEPAS|nr:FAD-dependent oxidoreductase [Peptoniphilus asaccharolyticus]MBL7575461.1 FAD-dependent oxidoreductase [Peptoniphilus asaccharolyticus]SMB86847.1 thioredoxin reductase (NADPH) [Peptoniphilus asaccharolyticus DSM 20463]